MDAVGLPPLRLTRDNFVAFGAVITNGIVPSNTVDMGQGRHENQMIAY